MKRISYFFRQNEQILAPLLIVILVYFSITLLYKSALLESLELYAYDQLVKIHSEASTDSPITVIKVTEEDIHRLASYPLSDQLLAEIFARLEAQKVRVIGFDIYRDKPVQPGHKQLNALLSRYQNIIAPIKYGDNKLPEIPAPPALKDSNQAGFIDGLLDRDNIVRRGLLYLNNNQQTLYYSLALRMALLYLQDEQITEQAGENGFLELGKTTLIPLKSNDGGYVNEDTKGYQFLFDFCKPPASIVQYTLAQFRSGAISNADFEDKIVLIGVDAESIKDHFYMSCNQNKMGRKKLTAGVMIHAAITDQLLRMAQKGHTPIKVIADGYETLWVLLCTLLGGLISQRQHTLKRLMLIWISGSVVLIGLTLVAFTLGWWLIVATPLLAWLTSSVFVTAYKAMQEKHKRKRLMNLFSRYVAPEIAEELWQKQNHFLTEGRPRPQQMTATVLFTDLQGFTTIAEGLEPSLFFNWLNEYLAEMTPVVASHGGVVIRFIGDAIFAGFGVPVPRHAEKDIRQDVINAVDCALAMNHKLIQLNKQWQQQQKPVVGMRIGLYTGLLAAGSIGDNERMEYTIHGDTVNTAARLEAYDKTQFIPDYFKQPCRILIGGKAVEYLENKFQLETMGKVSLK